MSSHSPDVEACPDVDAQVADASRIAEAQRYRPRRAVEAREEPVAGGVDLLAAKVFELAATSA